MTRAVLELSTLASLLFCYDSENTSFSESRLSDLGYWGKPLFKSINLLMTIFFRNGEPCPRKTKNLTSHLGYQY